MLQEMFPEWLKKFQVYNLYLSLFSQYTTLKATKSDKIKHQNTIFRFSKYLTQFISIINFIFKY